MKKLNRCRIIGGKWGSRVLNFPTITGLRPTPDAVRETVFNWLSADIAGARCLDLYAGSGALGFEALSRGAEQVTFVENDIKAFKALQQSKLSLGADDAELAMGAAVPFLALIKQPYDVVFLDPPYQSNELEKACYHLNKHKCVRDQGLVYLEAPARRFTIKVPDSWTQLKHAEKGDVSYNLFLINH